MEYVKFKDADKIVKSSTYVVNNPFNYKNKWQDLFGNKNPIHLELGMGRGEFIINMAILIFYWFVLIQFIFFQTVTLNFSIFLCSINVLWSGYS